MLQWKLKEPLEVKAYTLNAMLSLASTGIMHVELGKYLYIIYTVFKVTTTKYLICLFI